MQVSLVLLSWVLGFAELPPAAARHPPWHAVARDTEVPSDCVGTNYSAADAGTFHCGDWRLGPKDLPRAAAQGSSEDYESKVMGCILAGYDRLGGMTAGGLISNFTVKVNGYWRYPKADGFSAKPNGKADTETKTLKKNDYVDRFGSEAGYFLAPAGTLYKQRSIPPSNLNTQSPEGAKHPNFFGYRVNEPFSVTAGGIAPWFGQPGGGEQFHTTASGNISDLIKTGKLVRVQARELWDSGKLKCMSDGKKEPAPEPAPEPPKRRPLPWPGTGIDHTGVED